MIGGQPLRPTFDPLLPCLIVSFMILPVPAPPLALTRNRRFSKNRL